MKNRVIKVILFAVALAMSFIIIGKLYFIKTYDNYIPDKELILKNYKNEYIGTYSDTKNVKDTIMFSTIIILIITLIGLMAYSIDEINNRKKEISIRKINGATTKNILATILKKSIILSIIAIILGGIIAKLSAGYFISMFTNQISLNIFLFIACGILTFITIIAVQIFTILNKLENNMVQNLKEKV